MVDRVSEREVRILEPMAEAAEVGRWLSAMEDDRRDTLRELRGITDENLEVRPAASDNSVGSLLYHVALIEADWLVDDIFDTALADSKIATWFPLADRDGEGQLSEVRGEDLGTHLERLAAVRAYLIDQLRPMSVADFHTPRRRPQYDVSPAWVLHHLLAHEAEHRAEIGWLKHQVTGMR
jgi:hypothetical protein